MMTSSTHRTEIQTPGGKERTFPIQTEKQMSSTDKYVRRIPQGALHGISQPQGMIRGAIFRLKKKRDGGNM